MLPLKGNGSGAECQVWALRNDLLADGEEGTPSKMIRAFGIGYAGDASGISQKHKIVGSKDKRLFICRVTGNLSKISDGDCHPIGSSSLVRFISAPLVG